MSGNFIKRCVLSFSVEPSSQPRLTKATRSDLDCVVKQASYHPRAFGFAMHRLHRLTVAIFSQPITALAIFSQPITALTLTLKIDQQSADAADA